MFRLPTLFLTLLLVVPAVSGAETRRYSVLINGQTAGVQTATADGLQRNFVYEYGDRGRGPRLSSQVRLDPAGLPVVVSTTGHDYWKSRVDERFTFDGRNAAWKNRQETGSRALDANAFYVSATHIPEETALLAQALLSARTGKVRLLPEGEARIERVGDLVVEAGSQTRTVTQYAITGLDFAASPVWLDTDRQFFAVRYDNLTVIREGWESSAPALAKAEQAEALDRAGRMATSLASRPSSPLVIQHANLFDAERAAARPNMTVVLYGNRIVAVGPDGQVPLPSGAVYLDARGKTLIPGLWDMHAHLTEMDGPLNLAGGVTTARDMGSEGGRAWDLRRRFASGEAVGPRVILNGLIDARVRSHGPTDVLVSTEAEARAAVDRYATLGYDQIKVYSSLAPALLPAVVDQARRRGLRVGGHVPGRMTPEQAVRAGLRELNHVNYLFVNFLTGLVPDSARPSRFTAVAEHAAEIDTESRDVHEFIRLLKENDVVVDPTLTVFETMMTPRAGSIARGFVPVADRLPPQVRRGVLASELPVPEGMRERYTGSFRAMLKLVGMLHRAGVKIVAGGDSMGGFPIHRELELYVEAGIPPMEALRIATLDAARLMDRQRELGSIAPGKLADMALVDGDPTRNISDIRKVVLTIKDGALYRSAELYQAIGVLPKGGSMFNPRCP